MPLASSERPCLSYSSFRHPRLIGGGTALRLVALALASLIVAAGGGWAQTSEERRSGEADPAAGSAAAAATAVPELLLGGVPEGAATAEPIPLSLPDALGRALRRNLGVVEATQAVRLARAARDEARADLLPGLNARLSETRQKVNLAAFGFSGFPGLPDVPTVVGPFNVFDARAALTQRVLDLHALERSRAQSHNVRAAEYAFEDTRGLAVLVAGSLYLRAAAAQSSLDAAREQREAAEALHRIALDRKQAGVVAGIEVLRAQVQLQQRRERELAAANAVEKTKLDLARAIGLPLGQRFTLTDAADFAAAPTLSVQEALARAYESRADWKEAMARVRAADALRRAARGELLPSVSVSADYGQIGPNLAEARGTYTLNASVRVPVFEGGRAHARVSQAEAALEQRRAEAEDVRARIHYEVQGAFLDLSSSAARVQASGAAVELAREQVRQAQDRFAAGITGNIEVVQAQDALATARDAYVASVYDHNLAKASLARSLGLVEEAFAQFLRGQ